MAIDISKITNLLIDEGTETDPFILKESEVTTLYKLSSSGNTNINIKGYVNTESGNIVRYQSYQIKKAWPDLHVLAKEISSKDWTVSIPSNEFVEGNGADLVLQNIAAESLVCTFTDSDIELSVTQGYDYSVKLVKQHLHFDNTGNGRVYYDEPESNADWTCGVKLHFAPVYDPTDTREVDIVINARAVTALTIDDPGRIDESTENTITVAPYPANNTKGSSNCKYSMTVEDGTLFPVKGQITQFTSFKYTSPTFEAIEKRTGKACPTKEGQKYFMLEFTASFYMFGNTSPSGNTPFTIELRNQEFQVTVDKQDLSEDLTDNHNKATFTVLGYDWAKLQKQVDYDEAILTDITAEELAERIDWGNDSTFYMHTPTDNATYSATNVILRIAPPGAEIKGDRAFSFKFSFKAIGITDIVVNPQTIGQGMNSVITLTYKPTNHTKGTLTYGLTCAGLTFIESDPNLGKFTVYSNDVATYQAVASVYSSYLSGSGLLVSYNKTIVAQEPYFDVWFNDPEAPEEERIRTASFLEGGRVNCNTYILHISELVKIITVNITEGSDLITSDWILSRLHFSEDTTTDAIWFDSPKENISWKATISIKLIAGYIPDPESASYFKAITLNIEAKEATGVEWQYNGSNYQIATAPYRKAKTFTLKSIPYDNTKQSVLETWTSSPFTALATGEQLDINPLGSPYGRFNIRPNSYDLDWIVYGYLDAFSSSTDYGTVTKNIYGSTTQDGTPSTNNIIYPTSYTLYDKTANTHIEFRKVKDYKDAYIRTVGEETVTAEIQRWVGVTTLNHSDVYNTIALVQAQAERSATDNSICFSATILNKSDSTQLTLDSAICSHFKASTTDISTTDVVDVFTNNSSESGAEHKMYFRINKETVGIDDPSVDDETVLAAIKAYISDQADTNPITVYYPLAQVQTTAQANTLYYNNVFFTSKPYHIYTANNPKNQCYVKFKNNSTVAYERSIFGTRYDSITDNINETIAAMTTKAIRIDSSETDVPFFAGIPTSIDQYDEDGNLLVKEDGTAEKGEVNIWENFSGKYEETTDNEWAKITWDSYGETDLSLDGTQTPDSPIEITNKIVYEYDGSNYNEVELLGFISKGVSVSDLYAGPEKESGTGTLTRNIGKVEMTADWFSTDTGTATLTGYSIFRNTSLWSGKIGAKLGEYYYCTHFLTNNFAQNYTVANTLTQYGSSNQGFICISNTTLSTGTGYTITDSSSMTDKYAALTAWLAKEKAANQPVMLYYVKNTQGIVYNLSYYVQGNTYRTYTISKLINEDDTEGSTTAVNGFNKAFVFNKDGSIPTRFFLSRFTPGWNQNDNTGTISMAKGLKSQQRTITKDIISEKGCYYKDDDGELQQVDPIYYGPLLAYSWLAFMVYGNLNLKEAIGEGGWLTSSEGRVYADWSGTDLVPGTAYSTLWIANNGVLSSENCTKYNLSILGVAHPEDIATGPISSFKILSVDTETSTNYTGITIYNSSTQEGAQYTPKIAQEYYSLNACFAETGYSETYYKKADGTQAISGFGTTDNKTFYNNSRHPVRCLNVENMWGGGDYTIEGTGFVADEEDATKVRPILWNPEDTDQNISDMSTWETEDFNVLNTAGTWDIGSYYYHGARCGWPLDKAGEGIPYRGYNVYNRPTKLGSKKYNWVTGTYNYGWESTSDTSDMCGLGQTTPVAEGKVDIPGYTTLEYIESYSTNNNLPYIDLGVNYNLNMRLELKMAVCDITKDAKVFGHFHSGSSYYNSFAIYNSAWRGGSASLPLVKDKIITLGVFNKIGTIDGAYWKTFQSTEPTYSIRFGQTADPSGKGADWKFYDYKCYISNELTNWLIPCLRNSDSKLGMYDYIQKVFYTNACTVSGAPDFIAGPEKSIEMDNSDNRYYQLEKLYIDNQSEEISIDCGSKLSQKVKLSVDLKSSHIGDRLNYLGGSQNASSVKGLNLLLTHDKLYLEQNLSTSVTSATGSSTQTGTPTPTNMISIVDTCYYNNSHNWVRLRSLTDATDSYSSGTITRNVGVITLTGNELFTASPTGYAGKPTIYMSIPSGYNITSGTTNMLSNAFKALSSPTTTTWVPGVMAVGSVIHFNYNGLGTADAKEEFMSFLRKRYAEGDPVVIYAPLTTATTETVTLYENPDICLSGDTTILSDTRHTIEVEQTATALTAKIDGTTTYSGSTVTLDTTFKYYLFAVNDCDEINYNKSFNGTIYSFELYKNGKQIRNYVPVFDKAYDVFGLYDKVNKKFSKIDHTNPTKLASGIYKLDSICNTTGASAAHTPYIRLGSPIMASDVVEIEFSIDSSASSGTFVTLFGAETTPNDYACRVYVSGSRIAINNAQAALSLVVGTKYLLHMETDNNYVQLASGGTQYKTSKNTIDGTYAPDVFCLNRTNIDTDNKPGLTVYNISINGEEYIPAFNSFSEISGLYNTTSKVFYPSKANGDFIHEAITEEILALQPTDYITFTSGQYIDTYWNYTPGSTVKITASKAADSTSVAVPLFGNDVSSNQFSIGINDTAKKPYANLVSSSYALGSVSTAGKVYDLTLTTGTSASTLLGKGYGIASLVNSPSVSPTNQSTTCLLGTSRASDGTATACSINKNIYGCKIYEGTTLVKSFSPVYNLETKTYGMYDLVNDDFHGNDGSGTLYTGSIDTEVTYIQNTESAEFTNWNLDSGVFTKDTGKIMVDMDVETPMGVNKCIIGSKSTTAIDPSNNSAIYFCYSDAAVGGVTLTDRTVEGSKVTWTYTYSGTDNSTIHIAGGGSTETGTYKYKRITIYGTDNQTVLRDYIPIRCGITGGLYDTITGRSIFNQVPATSTATTYGSDVDISVPGDPGLIYKKAKLLTRVFGTL